VAPKWRRPSAGYSPRKRSRQGPGCTSALKLPNGSAARARCEDDLKDCATSRRSGCEAGRTVLVLRSADGRRGLARVYGGASAATLRGWRRRQAQHRRGVQVLQPAPASVAEGADAAGVSHLCATPREGGAVEQRSAIERGPLTGRTVLAASPGSSLGTIARCSPDCGRWCAERAGSPPSRG
jgi:hypothetical protein